MPQVEVIVGAGAEVMTLPEQYGDVAFRLIDHRSGGAGHHDVVEPRLPFDLFHHRRVGHEKRVVLILSGGRLPFHLENSDHYARLILDAHHLIERILRAEQLLGDGPSEDAHVARTLDVDIRVHATARNVPAFERKVIGSHTADGRAPVLIASDDLNTGIHLRRDVGDSSDLFFDRLEVSETQGFGAEGAGSNATAVHTARLDPDHVRADVGNSAFDVCRGTFADRDNEDHCADTNDDTEHRQGGAKGVLSQRFDGDTNRGEWIHDLTAGGRTMRKIDPRPARSTEIRPPFASTAHLAMAKPKPVPPISRERPSSMR